MTAVDKFYSVKETGIYTDKNHILMSHALGFYFKSQKVEDAVCVG